METQDAYRDARWLSAITARQVAALRRAERPEGIDPAVWAIAQEETAARIVEGAVDAIRVLALEAGE